MRAPARAPVETPLLPCRSSRTARRLAALRDQLPPKIGPSKRQTPSEVEKARLRALGYIAEDTESAADGEFDGNDSAESGDSVAGSRDSSSDSGGNRIEP